MNQPAGSANNSALKPSNSRQAKRLFVHNIPHSTSEDDLLQFINLQLNGLNVLEAISDPLATVQFSSDKTYAMLEFKHASDATVALALDGISMGDDVMGNSNGTSNGSSQGLSIQRPKDYIVPNVTDDSNYEAGLVADVVPDSQNKISISNIPTYLTDEQITELVSSFGELKAFVLAKDTGTGESRVRRALLRVAFRSGGY
jgi:splicing factor U2AF subunit